MVDWQPAGLVSPLPLPEACGLDDVIAVWMPVGPINPDESLPNLSNVPLVDAFEVSTFGTPKRALEHASARYALATLLRDIGFDPFDLRVVRDEHRKPNLVWRDHGARVRAGGALIPLFRTWRTSSGKEKEKEREKARAKERAKERVMNTSTTGGESLVQTRESEPMAMGEICRMD